MAVFFLFFHNWSGRFVVFFGGNWIGYGQRLGVWQKCGITQEQGLGWIFYKFLKVSRTFKNFSKFPHFPGVFKTCQGFPKIFKIFQSFPEMLRPRLIDIFGLTLKNQLSHFNRWKLSNLGLHTMTQPSISNTARSNCVCNKNKTRKEFNSIVNCNKQFCFKVSNVNTDARIWIHTFSLLALIFIYSTFTWIPLSMAWVFTH